MDSRVLASRFMYSSVGDNIIVRNAGNLIPRAENFSYDTVTTEAGALELGCIRNNIRHVVVCGHSDCKAMNLLFTCRHECHKPEGTPLQLWVKKHGQRSVEKFSMLSSENKYLGPVVFQAETTQRTFEAFIDPEDKFRIEDKFSQVNCLTQLQNIAGYPMLKDKLANDEVRLHAMWFDIYTGNVYMFSREKKRFIEINEENLYHLITDAESKASADFIVHGDHGVYSEIK
ncbi:hypothetical protein CHS0354_022605 [Potamilus streckersoni]|uniref:Carbonic anhydrase n=1 Tax=Potamilus streckersoni TaxID=2493646 RepID=A0AAE0RY49_9BIVA|nr:hypothetical protein CHS0354_022605 [Potamilus streckersoni]